MIAGLREILLSYVPACSGPREICRCVDYRCSLPPSLAGHIFDERSAHPRPRLQGFPVRLQQYGSSPEGSRVGVLRQSPSPTVSETQGGLGGKCSRSIRKTRVATRVGREPCGIAKELRRQVIERLVHD